MADRSLGGVIGGGPRIHEMDLTARVNAAPLSPHAHSYHRNHALILNGVVIAKRYSTTRSYTHVLVVASGAGEVGALSWHLTESAANRARTAYVVGRGLPARVIPVQVKP